MTRDAHVLVIEDDGDVLDLLLSHVRNLGWSVAGTGSGAHGLELAAAHPPALVLLDLLLADMHGREVIHALRAHPDTRGCAIVVSSVLDQQDVAELARELRVDATLPKPFTRQDVTRVLGAVLPARRSP